MKKEKTEGELFWEAVDKFEGMGYSHARSVEAARIITSKPKGGVISEKMWAVTFPVGERRAFYIGTWNRREDAKRRHSSDLGKTWEECYADGDRIERVVVTNAVF